MNIDYKPDVSVIVPVYNVEKYLDQCLNSLRNQTMQNIEIICVNDCSTDHSLEILEKHATEDNRIKIVDKAVNGGLAEARKDGVMKAKGEFVCFLDSDDYAEADFCMSLFEAIVNSHADIAECAYYTFDTGQSVMEKIFEDARCYSEEEFINNIVRGFIVNGNKAVIVWNKMYKKILIDSVVLDYGKSPLEDYMFNMQYFSAVGKYVYIPKPLINYRLTVGSLSRSFNSHTYWELKKVQQIKSEILQKMGVHSPEDQLQAALWYCSYTERYIKANMLLQKDRDLLKKICFDEELQRQAEICASRNRFASLINKKNWRLIVLAQAPHIPVQYAKRVLKSVLKNIHA